MMGLSQQQRGELDAIASRSEDGKLHARDVVKHARDPESSLHGKFEWDDTKAAAAYRLDQARSVIEVYVESLPGVGECRAYVSLSSDRKDGGGYVRTSGALAEPVSRDLLVEQMKADLRGVLRRHSYLRGVAGETFSAIEAVLEPKMEAVA